MILGTKARYAVMAMTDLAGRQGAAEGRAVALADIAARQEISLSYLEQLFARGAGDVPARAAQVLHHVTARTGIDQRAHIEIQALIAGGVLSGYAPAAMKPTWLPKIASGQALVVLAQQERKARYRLDVCDAKATAAGSDTVRGSPATAYMPVLRQAQLPDE